MSVSVYLHVIVISTTVQMSNCDMEREVFVLLDRSTTTSSAGRSTDVEQYLNYNSRTPTHVKVNSSNNIDPNRQMLTRLDDLGGHVDESFLSVLNTILTKKAKDRISTRRIQDVGDPARSIIRSPRTLQSILYIPHQQAESGETDRISGSLRMAHAQNSTPTPILLYNFRPAAIRSTKEMKHIENQHENFNSETATGGTDTGKERAETAQTLRHILNISDQQPEADATNMIDVQKPSVLLNTQIFKKYFDISNAGKTPSVEQFNKFYGSKADAAMRIGKLPLTVFFRDLKGIQSTRSRGLKTESKRPLRHSSVYLQVFPKFG